MIDNHHTLEEQKLIERLLAIIKDSDKSYLLDIDEWITDLEFGRLDFSISVSYGKPTDIIRVANKRKRYEKNCPPPVAPNKPIAKPLDSASDI